MTNPNLTSEIPAASSRFFFRKENRVLKRADFLETYDRGRAYRRKLAHVFVMARPDAALPTRLGITATRKTGNAVRRNRARRMVREVFRLALPELRPGFTIIVNVLRATADAPFEELDRQLRGIFREAGLIREQAKETPVEAPRA